MNLDNLIPYNPKELNKTFRLSVHRTGRIGFTAEAAERMDLKNHTSSTISRNGADENDTNLYLILHADKDTGAFKINTNGPYYSINIKLLLESIGIEYEKGQAWFEMEEIKIQEQKVYKLARRGKQFEIPPIVGMIIK